MVKCVNPSDPFTALFSISLHVFVQQSLFHAMRVLFYYIIDMISTIFLSVCPNTSSVM